MASEVRPTLLNSMTVLGLPISKLSMAEVLTAIDAMIREASFNLIVTADANCLILARDNPQFRKDVECASLITADGSGVLWALRRKGCQIEEKVSGVELAERLIEESADKGYRIFMLGGEPGVAEQAADKMKLKYPGCNIVGTRHGYFPASDDTIVAEQIQEFDPDVLLVAMGMPRQERFIVGTKDIIGAPVNIGVGGTFDVMSGRVKRAPAWVRKLHMEWFWRTVLNPSKWAKVKNLPRFVILILRGKD